MSLDHKAQKQAEDGDVGGCHQCLHEGAQARQNPSLTVTRLGKPGPMSTLSTQRRLPIPATPFVRGDERKSFIHSTLSLFFRRGSTALEEVCNVTGWHIVPESAIQSTAWGSFQVTRRFFLSAPSRHSVAQY